MTGTVMKFMEYFARAFGMISVKETGNLVKITGVDGLILRNHFKILFETDVIAKKMFTSITDTAFTLNRFFVPDLIFMLAKLRHDERTTWSGKRTIDKIVKGLLEDTWFKVSTGEVKSIIDMKRLNQMKWQAMPKQIEFLHLFGDRMPRYDLRGYIIGFAPGGGKALGLEDLIRTPSGWMRNGDMTVGQPIVTPDGGTSFVTGVYPQGELDMYEVTFEDGRSVECCDDHLWKVRHKDWARSNKDGRVDGWKVVPFIDIRLHMDNHQLEPSRLYVPLPEPEIKEDVQLSIDPYLLGIILGDGHIREGTVSISSADGFIVDQVSHLLPDDSELVYRPDKSRSSYDYQVVKKTREKRWSRSMLVDQLHALKLNSTRSHTKFVPDVYLNASFSQKLALIQGLMDSDGTVSENGSTSFCTTSEQLAKHIQELIRSIGGLARIKTKQTHYTYKGERKEGKPAYQVNIRYREPTDLFRLPRKKELTPENYQYKDSLRLRIEKIRYVGKKQAQCISVDHPDRLYITNDYIVTHNTFLDLCVAECVVPPSVADVKIIISPKKALHLVWEKTINSVFKKTPTYWCCDSGLPMPEKKTEYYIFNFEQINKAIELGKKIHAQGRKYFVIVDESHNFADWRSNRTQQLVKLQTLRDDVLFLWTSGSPILKSAAEMVSFLKCSDHRFDADAERRFKQIFTMSPGKAGEIFQHRLGQQMAFMVGKSAFSATKPVVKELPVRLPPALAHKFLMSTVREEMKEFIQKQLTMYKDNIKHYRKLVDFYMNYHENKLESRQDRQAFYTYQKNLKMIMRAPDLMMTDQMAACRTYERTKLYPSIPPINRSEFRNALSAVKNLKLKVRGEALGTILAKRRSECAAALGVFCKPDVIMKESLSKTLFFASSVLPVKVLSKHLTDQGFEPLMVYADTNADLTKNINRFTDDPNVNPICATMQSLSEAVPVIAASTVVLLNRPYRQATYDQVIARADRLGQIHPVTIIEVTLDTGGVPNVSSRTDEILAEVRELINSIVGADFAGPDPDEREYKQVIDASKESANLELEDERIGL
jgi:hypothetical protein